MDHKYISQGDLESALSADTVLRLYDDGDGQVDTLALDFQIDSAEAEVDSWILGNYDEPLLVQADRLVKRAAVLFLIHLSFDRHPEYVRTFGEDKRHEGAYERATALMERIAKAIQRLPDQPGPPANVGGDVSSTADAPGFPTPVRTVFEDMGDF